MEKKDLIILSAYLQTLFSLDTTDNIYSERLKESLGEELVNKIEDMLFSDIIDEITEEEIAEFLIEEIKKYIGMW